MTVDRKSRVRWIATTIVGAALVFGAVLWHSMPNKPAPRVATRVRLTPVQQSPSPPVAYAAPDPTGKSAVVGTDASVSKDTIRLQLFATFPGKDAHEGTAVLGTNKVNPQTYGAGSVLASGAIIDEIHQDFVVLKFNGARTKLYRAGLGNQQTDDTLLTAITVGGPGISDKPIDTRITSQESFATILRSRLVFDDEKVIGFEIAAGRDSSALKSLGMEPGDVVRSIDGHPVTADADWHRITKALSTGGSVVLGIERQGSLLSISMDASQINNSPEQTAGVPPMPPNS